ncbi:MAG: ABC transporter permease subunit [Chloroflexi bacterium]|nr:ABC transporter permease subunit [Chloroflexota bacterium]
MNPVLVQELRVRMRGGQAYLLLTGIILVFGGVCLSTFWALSNLLRPIAPFAVPTPVGGVGGGVQSAATQTSSLQLDRLLISQRSVVFFLIMALWAVLLAALIVPGTTSGTVARERETRSLPLLLGTPLSTFGIVAGKLIAAASYVLLVIAAAIPLFAMVVMFGGVPLTQVLAVVIILLVTTFAFAAMGVYISSVARNGLLACLISYTLVLLVTVASYVVYLASSPLSKAINTKYALYFSPLAAVMSAMDQDNLQLDGIIRQLFRDPGARVPSDWWALSHYPLWQVTTVGYLLAGLLFLVAASRVINPLRRWL